MAYCKICDTTITAHKSELVRHSKSKKHLILSRDIQNNQDLSKVVKDGNSLKDVKRAELKLAGLIVCNNLPFTLIGTLVPLLKDICPDYKIAEKQSIKRVKTSNMVKHALGSTFLEMLYAKLREPGSFCSLIMDETTGCALTVVYIDNVTSSVKTNFFDMYEMISSKAKDLFNGMTNSITGKNIPLENFVGFSSDTTNSMVGQHKSVFSFLKRNHPPYCLHQMLISYGSLLENLNLMKRSPVF